MCVWCYKCMIQVKMSTKINLTLRYNKANVWCNYCSYKVLQYSQQWHSCNMYKCTIIHNQPKIWPSWNLTSIVEFQTNGVSIHILAPFIYFYNSFIDRRCCGARIRVEMSNGRTRRDRRYSRYLIIKVLDNNISLKQSAYLILNLKGKVLTLSLVCLSYLKSFC